MHMPGRKGSMHSRECIEQAGLDQGWAPTAEELANAGPSYVTLPPQQSAQPVAWMHETPGRVDVIHDEVKKLLSAVATDYLHRPIDKSEKYTIPLYAAAQPVEVQPLTVSEINAAFDKHKAAICLVGSEIQHYRIAVANAIQEAHGIKPTSREGRCDADR